MKRTCFIVLYSCLTVSLVSAQSVEIKKNDIVGIFDGRTPCQEFAKQVNQPTTPDCIKIKWRLTLYKGSININSGTYRLEGFVFRRDNVLTGNWKIIKGSKSDPEALVYQLDHPVKGPLYFQKGDEDVLFFLDKQKNLMIGNRNFSYALYRVTQN
jgi:hypothetical protein